MKQTTVFGVQKLAVNRNLFHTYNGFSKLAKTTYHYHFLALFGCAAATVFFEKAAPQGHIGSLHDASLGTHLLSFVYH